MNYFLISVDSLKNSNLEQIALDIGSGYASFFVRDCQKIYYIYSCKKGKLISPLWRRGINISDTNLTNTFKNSQNDFIRKIRRSDFKIIFRDLKNKQIQESTSISLHLFQYTLLLISSKNNIKNYQHYTLSKYEKNINNTILKYQKKQLRNEEIIFQSLININKYSEIEEIKNTLLKRTLPYKLTFIGDSFKVLSFLALYLLPNQKIYYFIIIPSEYLKIKKRYIAQKKSIQKVLIISNLFNISNLEFFQNSFWNNPLYDFLWNHIEGNFSTERVESILKEALKYDIVIYRGHSYIKNGNITWLCSNGEYILPNNVFNTYIHLGCLNYINIQDYSIHNIPFNYGVLPISYLIEEDYTPFIYNLFCCIKNNDTFKEAITKAICYIKNNRFVFL